MPPPWLIYLLDTEERYLSGPDQLPARLRMFREAFAGAAMLTRCMRARGIPIGRPLEAYPSIDNTGRDGKYIFGVILTIPRQLVILVWRSVRDSTCTSILDLFEHFGHILTLSMAAREPNIVQKVEHRAHDYHASN